MPELRPRPDIDQLRRQARELLRAAQSADPTAVASLERLDAPTTLTGAQLTLAREHGFASWATLKQEVERRAVEPIRFVLRYVRSPDDLRALWLAINRIVFGGPPEPARWRGIFDDFEARRTTMLVTEHDGRTVGGTVQLNVLGIEPWARGIGLGRRLVQTVEVELLSAGQHR